MQGFPPTQVRVVATCAKKRFAVVLLETNDGPPFEAYQVLCRRVDEGWMDGTSGNGPGWTVTEEGVGVLTYWDVDLSTGGVVPTMPPAGFGESSEEGFLFCRWDVPEDDIPDLMPRPPMLGHPDGGAGFIIDIIE